MVLIMKRHFCITVFIIFMLLAVLKTPDIFIWGFIAATTIVHGLLLKILLSFQTHFLSHLPFLRICFFSLPISYHSQIAVELKCLSSKIFYEKAFASEEKRDNILYFKVSTFQLSYTYISKLN